MKRLKLDALQKSIGSGEDSFRLEADFEVAPGERAVLTGASGGGKTTLLRMIAGLERPDRGKIWIGEEEISELSPQDRQLGYVFQDHALFPSMTTLENVAFGLRMRGMPASERNGRALEWLERVGLGKKGDQAIGTLSGGERSRVAFARALITEPRVLLLDEPFAALDSALRADLRGEVLSLLKRCPAPLILVSHDAEDAAALATVRLSLEIGDGGARRIKRVGI